MSSRDHHQPCPCGAELADECPRCATANPFGSMRVEPAIGSRGSALQSQERRAVAASLSSYPHVYHHVDFEGEDIYDLPEDAPAEVQESASKARAVVHDAADATVFSSLIRGQQIENTDDALHTVALDIDLPAQLLPSSTEGHFHLLIDKPMPWRDYLKLLKVMGEVGLVEPGYVGASERRLATHLRMPWVKKSEAEA